MSEAGDVLNILLVGAGLIGERHARVINQMPDMRLCAMVDPSDAARDLAKDLDVPLFDDLYSFLEAGIHCDGTLIATPNETHKNIATQCLGLGFPCLIEKPLAADSQDARAIVEVSEKSGVPVLVGHHRRHHEVCRLLKEKLDNGDIGQLVGAQSTWMLRKPSDYFSAGEWRSKKGGGPIWINFIHEIDLLRYFLGEITQVSAMVSNTIRGNGVEDSAVINMRFDNGALVSAMLSDAAPSPWHFEGGTGENPNICKTNEGGLRIFGTTGSIEVPSLRQWQHENDEGHWGTPIYAMAGDATTTFDGETALTVQLHNFVDVIKAGAKPLVSAQDGLQSVRVVEAIHRSAHEGKTIIISTD